MIIMAGHHWQHQLSASLHHGSGGMIIGVVFVLLMLKVIAGNRG